MPKKDSNFLKENNARYQFHPMAHPADSLANPPKIITAGVPASRLKRPLAGSLKPCRIIRLFGVRLMMQ